LLAGVVGRFRLDINAAEGNADSKSQKLAFLQVLKQRASAQLERLSSNLEILYGGHPDVPAVLKKMLDLFIARGLERPDELKQLDAAREGNPNWFNSNKSVGSAMYVDRHCGTLSNLEKEINYLKLMNVNMLHLMPTIYKAPEKNNDGGYAISDFRSVNPAIGTMDELRELFCTMRKNFISPVMDVTVNHVAEDHAWALAAKAGDPEKLGYFYAMGEAEKNEYEKHLIPFFPDIRPGSFTWNDDTQRFMWTSFMSSQWDLNYSNPKTLLAVADEMTFLLNQGAEVLRLDAVLTLWKEKGTTCTQRPEVQVILEVFNAMSRIAAPGTVLLAEHIDVPENLKRNLGPDKCQMAYNTMPLIHMWDALAHQDASFMAEALRRHANTPEGTALLNMVRTHDVVGFHFDPVSAEKLGIDLSQRWQQLRDF
jgi:amylosucrase